MYIFTSVVPVLRCINLVYATFDETSKESDLSDPSGLSPQAAVRARPFYIKGAGATEQELDHRDWNADKHRLGNVPFSPPSPSRLAHGLCHTGIPIHSSYCTSLTVHITSGPASCNDVNRYKLIPKSPHV